MPIKNGDKVKIDYTGSLEDGTVFDSSEKHGKPLEFEVGSGQVIKGFDEAVKGMEKGQEKDISLNPEDAYGPSNPQLIKKVGREQLPTEPEPKEGMALAVKLPDGNHLPAKITEIKGKEVTLDLNHPLAGKKLKFNIKAVDVIV
jgi:FKBP-type peptidyl-prolyl cis-trans isomerase 2